MLGTHSMSADFGRMAGAMAGGRHQRRDMNARRRKAASEHASEMAGMLQSLGKSRMAEAREQRRKAAADRNALQHQVESLLGRLRQDMEAWSAHYAQQVSLDRSALQRDVQDRLADFRESLRDWSVKHARAAAAAGSELERQIRDMLMRFQEERLDGAARLRDAMAVEQESRSVGLQEAAKAVNMRIAGHAADRAAAVAMWSGKRKASEASPPKAAHHDPKGRRSGRDRNG